jgi:hypothetical protein
MSVADLHKKSMRIYSVSRANGSGLAAPYLGKDAMLNLVFAMERFSGVSGLCITR